ncbi:unnamed protein product [Adineta ricciae]|uniref:ATP-dependent DNA helicase n=1 Tax=Adineta ricciae TaxID=249248 RepID=A0A813VHN8_ADIRI|nr:unnamed protein product [Adineta ricciae]
MAMNEANSPVDESVFLDDNDDGISVHSSRTTTHLKRNVERPDNNNGYFLVEKGAKGVFVTVNRLKHFGFIKRKNQPSWPDVFAREASLNDRVHPKKFFVGDTCKFDIIKTSRGYEAIDIDITERNINSISKLGKIPKKKETNQNQTEVSGELFQSTLRRASSHKTERQDDEFKTEDNKRRAEALKIARKDDEFKTEDNKRRAAGHRIERQDIEFKTEDNKRRAEALKIARKDDEFKQVERRKNALRIHNNREKYKNNFDTMKSDYESKIKEGPTHICSCCGGLWFEYSIREYTVEMLTNKGLTKEFIDTVCYLKHALIKLCATCRKDIMSKKVPNLSLSNGLAFYEVPDCLKVLTELEERLISPRIPFMAIRSLGFCKQFGLKGNLVNVPMNVDTNVSILPRSFSDTHTIQLKLIRQMKNKNAFMYETIRPKVVHTAIAYLVKQELYKDEGIVISNDWIKEYSNERENFIVNNEDKKVDVHEKMTEDVDQDDDWNECDDKPINPVATETLLYDESEDRNDTGIKFAPGENNRPISILMDLKVDELTFPKIYCGKQRKIKENVKLTYAKIAKSELRMFDRRCGRVSKLFFTYKKLQTRKFADAISINLRKTKNTKNVTVAQMLNRDYVNGLIHGDDAFTFLRFDRSSPAFWELKKKEVMAMTRQLGCPTLFLTLSAAETQWSELIVMLTEVLENKVITLEEAENMDYEKKCELIRNDLVTCVRYFEHRLKCLWEILSAPCGPFQEYELVDKYVRIEFQARGSPHVHALLWLKNAPKYDKNDPESVTRCVEFIDKLISVNAKPTEFSEELICLQRHKHSFTCKIRVNGEIKCRFDIPYFPMSKTMILEPLGDDETLSRKKREEVTLYRQNVKKELDKISKDKDNVLTFEEFLNNINMNEEEYIQMIRAGLKKPKVFLKRAPNEIRINAYNPLIMSLHRANMDIQFILDPYACLTYCVDYISNSENGTSKLLRDALNELKQGNNTVKERLRIIANKFLNSSEISAQEAVYHILSIPLSVSSRSTIFINTNKPENRISMLKSDEILQKLESDSKDVFVEGLIDIYSNRPDEMKDVCLADFASLYNVSKRKIGSTEIVENSDDENNTEEVDERAIVLKMKNGKGWIKKRTKKKIIRFRNFKLHQDPENYYREQLMLFLPWNNEEEDLIYINHEEQFELYKDLIQQKRSEYVHREANEFEKALAESKERENENDIDDTNIEYDQDKNEFLIYEMGNNEGDIFLEMGLNTRSERVEHFNVPKQIPNTEYEEMMRNLNDNQRKYTLNAMNLIKNSDKQFFHFINGGAGVGKSTLIKGMYQSLLRFFDSLPGSNPQAIRIAICAPTGKAAALLDGMTLHSFLSLPINQCKSKLVKLDSDLSNRIGVKLKELQLLIIDEISMVGFTMFQHVDARLQQIMRNKKPFGGISVIVLGDFNQLRPVGDKYIFQYNNSYNALVDNPLWTLFELFELTEIMRQKDDKAFAISLSNLAKGMMTVEDINLFKSRIISTEKVDVVEDAIRIFRSNAEVDAYNTKVLANLNTEGATAKAYDFCVGDGLASVKEKVLSNVKKLKTTETYGLPLQIELKVGAKYMMTVNIDIEDGLVNGACGKLVMIDYGKLQKTNEAVPCRLWIKFNEEKTGRKARANFQSVMRYRNIDLSLTPVEPVTRQINTRSTNFKVERKQFPVVPCEAMTIYKSQGGTYEKVVVNLKKGMTRSELYVACSRATKASGLYLIGDFVPPKPPEHNDTVAMMFKAMRSERKIHFSLEFPEESPKENIYLMFHNVQSLHKHFLDVKCDRTFLSATIISLVETWTKPSDNLEIEGFKIVHRRDCHDIRKPFGQITYLKNHLKYEVIAERYEYSGINHIEYSSIKIDDLCLISVYNSPNSAFDVLKRHIDEVITVSKRACEKIVIVGDFNIDLKPNNNHKFIDYITSFGFTLISQLNKNSTNAKTQIDYCFANVNDLKSDYFESLTSFHKPIWVTKHEVLTELHLDETEDIHTIMSCNIDDTIDTDHSDAMEVDNKFAFDHHETVDDNEQIDLDMSLQLADLSVNEPSDMMEIEENSSSENFEIIDSNSRKILNRFLVEFNFDNTIETNQFMGQVRIISDLIKKSPFITMQNKDNSVRLETRAEYPVRAFDSVYTRTRTTGDGNCLYSSLSILSVGSEKLTHSMRLLAVYAVITNRSYFQKLCNTLGYTFE